MGSAHIILWDTLAEYKSKLDLRKFAFENLGSRQVVTSLAID